MARIIQLTPYPLTNLIHGGQIRCHAIATALRQAGHEVLSFAIYTPGSYPQADINDIPLPPERLLPDPELIYFTDYFSGVYAAANDEVMARVDKLFARFMPGVVLVEQPWLFPVVEKLAAKYSFWLIYSSQNIEWRLKEKLLSPAALGRHKPVIESVRALEERLITSADYVFACTVTDADEFKRQANPANVLIAPNAVSPFEYDSRRVTDWYWHFGKRPYALFVGSHHLPNANGFWEMLQPGLAFLGPRQKIVVVGGVCNLLFSHAGHKPQRALNEDRIVLAGYQTRPELLALLMASSLVILPITQGEGSNLKTAEALYSQKPVLATPAAFRGYEFALLWPNVSIADTSETFRAQLKKLLDSPPTTPYNLETERLARLTWQHALRNLVNLIRELGPKAGRDVAV